MNATKAKIGILFVIGLAIAVVGMVVGAVVTAASPPMYGGSWLLSLGYVLETTGIAAMVLAVGYSWVSHR